MHACAATLFSSVHMHHEARRHGHPWPQGLHTYAGMHVACACAGTLPLELGGDCAKADAYELGPLAHAPRYRPGSNDNRYPTHELETGFAASDPHDGPRGPQHPELPATLRRTAAALRVRGNYALTAAPWLAVDIADLSSHDLCAYARGPAQIKVGYSGAVRQIEGTIFRWPSARPAAPSSAAVSEP